MRQASGAHPSARLFLTVGAILAVITAVEFGILYVSALGRAAMATILALLSALKFAMVALYFMHLRFDSKLLTAIFAVGLTLAVLTAVALKYINLA